MGKRGPKKGEGGRPIKASPEILEQRRKQRKRTAARREIYRYFIRALSKALVLDYHYRGAEPHYVLFEVCDDVHSKLTDKIRNCSQETMRLLRGLYHAGIDTTETFGVNVNRAVRWNHEKNTYQDVVKLPEDTRQKIAETMQILADMVNQLPEFDQGPHGYFDGFMKRLPLDEIELGDLK